MNRIIAAISTFATTAAVAQPLQSVMTVPATSTNWGLIWLGVLTVAVIVGFVYLQHRNPTDAAKIEAAAGAGAKAAATTMERMLSRLVGHFEPSAESPAVIEAATVTSGKAGVPGTFVISVTGDPSVDQPAILAQYFAK